MKKYMNYLKKRKYIINTFTRTNGIQHFYEKFGAEIFKKYFFLRFLLTGKVSIMFLEYKVTSKCTLCCKECSHFLPLYKKHMQPLSFETFKADIDKLLESVDIIYGLSLVGGETLLAKDLYKMVEYAVSKKQIKYIGITTNGTLIPDEKLLSRLSGQKKCVVWISNYTANKLLVPQLNIEKLVELLKKHNINYQVLDFTNEWMKVPTILSPEESRYNRTNSYDCWLSKCNQYSDGIIYLCPAQFYIKLNANNYNISTDEIINIRDNSYFENRKKIFRFYCKENYTFCNYCELNLNKKVPVAEQRERSLV